MPTGPVGTSSPPRILLLCASEDYAALEKRALREAGIREVRLLSSGAQAARRLAGLEQYPDDFRPDIVICTQKLADMDGEQFCAILRLHPMLLAVPVLLIMPSSSEAEQLRTLGCGASALLGRPYTVDELKSQLEILFSSRLRLEKLAEAARHSDTRAFDEALATYGSLLKPSRQPEDFFRVGMACLEQGRWNNALNAFQRALRSAQIKGEAELGIASAWKGKGDQKRFNEWLARAADTFVLARRWHRARISFARLLQDDPKTRNPYLRHARQLIGEGKVNEAAEMLAQGFEASPKGQFRHKLVQTLLATDERGAMLDALEKNLEKIMGNQGCELADSVRSSLDVLAEEQKEQRRLAALDRQWQMSRRLAEQRADEEADDGSRSPDEATSHPGREAENTRVMQLETLTPVPDAKTSFRNREHAMITPAELDNAVAENDSAAAGEAGNPLSENEAVSGLFSSSPRLNELLSVIKLTWKLARKIK